MGARRVIFVRRSWLFANACCCRNSKADRRVHWYGANFCQHRYQDGKDRSPWMKEQVNLTPADAIRALEPFCGPFCIRTSIRKARCKDSLFLLRNSFEHLLRACSSCRWYSRAGRDRCACTARCGRCIGDGCVFRRAGYLDCSALAIDKADYDKDKSDDPARIAARQCWRTVIRSCLLAKRGDQEQM